MSVLLGVVTGFIAWFYYGNPLLIGLLLLSFISVLIYTIGCFFIKVKMNSLIDRILRENHLSD
jgi:hypothetical protein